MFSNGFNITFKQFCHLVSIQPNGFIFYFNRQRDAFIFCFKYNDFIFINHRMIIPEGFEPPVRILRATIPVIGSQSRFRILLSIDYLLIHYL